MLQGLEELHKARQELYGSGLKSFAGELTLMLRPIEHLHQRLKPV
jgi:hypothetical protein